MEGMAIHQLIDLTEILLSFEQRSPVTGGLTGV